MAKKSSTTKLEKLQQKQKKIQLEINREKKKTSSKTRKDDTRRKILTGAVIIEAMKKDTKLQKLVNDLLSNKLIRDNDRKLFDLPPLKK